MSETSGLRIYQEPGGSKAVWESMSLPQPTAGEVTIEVAYSSINYKDALAATGRAKILRNSPLFGGIDLAGQVIESKDPGFSPGDWVLANGSGLSETVDGGYLTHACLSASQRVMPMPPGLDARQAMLIGTAGFTAALAITKMEHNAQTPALGKVLVTGATGGVGSFAIHLLAKLGYDVVALTRKTESVDYLKRLGAAEVVHALDAHAADLARAEWGGVIDTLGGKTLANLLKAVHPQGNVVSIGLAESPQLDTTVLPFIIRGINLLGATSANCPFDLKAQVWQRLADDLLPDATCFETVLASEVPLSELASLQHFERLLEGKVQGRFLVNCQK